MLFKLKASLWTLHLNVAYHWYMNYQEVYNQHSHNQLLLPDFPRNLAFGQVKCSNQLQIFTQSFHKVQLSRKDIEKLHGENTLYIVTSFQRPNCVMSLLKTQGWLNFHADSKLGGWTSLYIVIEIPRVYKSYVTVVNCSHCLFYRWIATRRRFMPAEGILLALMLESALFSKRFPVFQLP